MARRYSDDFDNDHEEEVSDVEPSFDDPGAQDDHDQRPDPFALCVVARARSGTGVGYLGFRDGRFYRPVHRTRPTMRFFAYDLLLDPGRWYDFPVLGYPGRVAGADHPHAHEDTLVARGEAPTPTGAREPNGLFDLLRPVAKDSLREIFPGAPLLRDGGAAYAHEGAVTPSVGVLRCPRGRVRVARDARGRLRAHVDLDDEEDVWYVRMKVEEEDEEVEEEENPDPGEEEEEVLLLLELGRAFDHPDVPPPARCYLSGLALIRQNRRVAQDGAQPPDRDDERVRDEVRDLERELEAARIVDPEEAFTEELLADLAERRRYKILPRARYDETVTVVREGRRANRHEAYCNERYEVRTVDGTDYLIQRRRDDRDPVRWFLCAEDLYDVVHRTHLETEHGSVNTMFRELARTYGNVTKEVLRRYLRHCEQCNRPRHAR